MNRWGYTIDSAAKSALSGVSGFWRRRKLAAAGICLTAALTATQGLAAELTSDDLWVGGLTKTANGNNSSTQGSDDQGLMKPFFVGRPVKVVTTPEPIKWGLSGDWGGVRTELFKNGLTLHGAYEFEPGLNISGGTRRMTDYAGQHTFGIGLDFDKILGWKGASLTLTLTSRQGRDLNRDAGINAVQQLQELYGRGDTIRITQFYFQQKFYDDQVEWRIGKLDVGSFVMDRPCDALNLAFCSSMPGNLTTYWLNWPLAQLGTIARVNTSNKSAYLQFAAFELNKKNMTFDYGLNPLGTAPSPQGALLPLELGLNPVFGERGDLKGTWMIGAWYATLKMSDLVLDVNGNLQSYTNLPYMSHRGSYGVYASIEQLLYHPIDSVDERQGLRMYVNFVQNDRRSTKLDNQLNAALLYRGAIENRPHDDFFVGFGRTHINGHIASAYASQGYNPRDIPHNEYVAETYYRIQIKPWWYAQPDFQAVFRPGGVASGRTAMSFSLKSLVTF